MPDPRRIADVTARPHTRLSVANADYARAEKLLPHRTNMLVLHEPEMITWMPGGKFWYRTRADGGNAFWLVDPEKVTRHAIFDPDKVSVALQRARGKPDQPSSFSFEGLVLSEDERTLAFQFESERWQCDVSGNHCTALPPFTPNSALSPDGKLEVFIRSWNLWLREIETGHEIQLTTDGTTDYGYATDSQSRKHTDRPCVLWSPDSKRVATYQLDERGVGEMMLPQVERGYPRLKTWKYTLPGSATLPAVHRVIIDVETARIVRLQMPPDLVRSESWWGLGHELTSEYEAQWSPDSAALFFVSVSRDYKVVNFRIADAITGAVQSPLEESAEPFYESAMCAFHALKAQGKANWRCLPRTREVLWCSSRDNWSHLYLYDLQSGDLKRQITSGEWNVVSVLHVDKFSRVVYFLAVGREAGRNPYYAHLYRVDLDGGDPSLLTPENAAHVVSMAPDGSCFVDTYSTPDRAPVTVLRKNTSAFIQTLERTDTSRLLAAGWTPPVPIVAKASDGVTDLYGLMFRPSSFDERSKYPIVNAIYSAPFLGSVIPRGRSLQWGAFAAAYGWLSDVQSLAELGFIVVMIDSRGTPLRSRAFHNVVFDNYGDASLPDQVAAMKHLAHRHSWIDIDRAGIYGHSHGGYATARAMFTYPEFFKVGVAIGGNHDPMSYVDSYYEKYMGLPQVGKDGISNYDRQANMHLARNLKGKLLLIHGMQDTNVTPYHTFLLVDALIAANKDFDLLLLPHQTHDMEAGAPGRYMIRRHWDYFVRHLLEAEPPSEYEMSAPEPE